MKNTLHDIQEKLNHGFYQNEEHVRLCIVSRILKQCGWDIWNPSEVNAEFVAIPNEDRTKVDFALFGNAYTPSVFIEIKSVGKIGANLASVERQLRDYNRNNTALFSIITDGNNWRFYYSQTGGEFSQKCFKTFSIQDGDLDDIEISFYTFLNKDEILSGEAEKLANEYLRLNQRQRAIEDSLPQARRIIQSPPFPSLPQCLVDLVEEKGFKISIDEATEYIRESQSKKDAVQQPPEIVSPPGRPPVSKPVHSPGILPPLIRSQSELIITIAWKVAGISRDDEIIDSHKAVDSMVISLRRIVEEFGEGLIDKLKTVQVRGMPLIIEGRSKSYHQQKLLGFKHYIVVVHSSNQDKVNIFKKVCRCLSLPDHFIKVKIND